MKNPYWQTVSSIPVPSVHNVLSHGKGFQGSGSERTKEKKGLTLPVLVVPALLPCCPFPMQCAPSPLPNGLTLEQRTAVYGVRALVLTSTATPPAANRSALGRDLQLPIHFRLFACSPVALRRLPFCQFDLI